LTEEEKKAVENKRALPKEPLVPPSPMRKNQRDRSVSLHQQVDTLKTELEKTKSEACTNLDGWQRERAEFSNYKKRVDRENEQMHQTLTGSVIKKYLVILDDLDLALKARPKEGEGAAWADGIELITRKLQSILDSEGIERINQNKVQFDPNLHEAISNEDNPDFECGEIIEVSARGTNLAIESCAQQWCVSQDNLEE